MNMLIQNFIDSAIRTEYIFIVNVFNFTYYYVT